MNHKDSQQSVLCICFSLSEFLSHIAHTCSSVWLYSQLVVCFHNITSSQEFTAYFLLLPVSVFPLSPFCHYYISTSISIRLPWNKWDLCHDNTNILDHNLHHLDSCSLTHPFQLSVILIITYNAFLYLWFSGLCSLLLFPLKGLNCTWTPCFWIIHIIKV